MNLKLFSVTCVCLFLVGIPVSAEEKQLPFLKNIEEFGDFTLAITEPELRKKIAGRGIYSDRTVDDSGRVNYWLLTENGENVNVMFGSSGKCSGIQRRRPVPKTQIRKQIGDAASRKWERDIRKLRLAKEKTKKDADAKRD